MKPLKPQTHKNRCDDGYVGHAFLEHLANAGHWPAFWTFRNLVQEVKRLDILINKTREELAKDYVTKTEVHNDMNRVMDRLDALDAKIDRLIESRTA